MKKSMKKKLSLIMLMLITTIALVGCGGSTKPTESAGIFKPGTYTATTEAYKGEMKVEVEFDKDKILAIKVLEHVDTEGLADNAFNDTIEKILEAQSSEVETVTGATESSNALMKAVQDAIDQAKI